MSEPIKLTASDEDLLGQMARFAERMAGEGGIYYHRGYSRSLGKFVVTLIGIGENAELIDKLISRNQPPQHNLVEVEKNDGRF